MIKGASIFLIPVFLMIFAAPSPRQSPRPLSFNPVAVDRFINRQMAAQRLPGLALAITQGDQVLYVQGYGDAGNGSKVTPQTQFLIASVSKSFTALAVMQLVEAGKIDLDAPVQRYLPEFTTADPGTASQITIRHLLNLTSGLSETGFADLVLPQPETIEERVTSLRDARPVARPGLEYHYFNPNYGVLARVVEVVSGQPFSDYLERHIFAPLEMQETISVVTVQEGQQRASALADGHLMAFGLPVRYGEIDGYLGGSAGVITTAEDMAHYLIAMINDGRYKNQQLAQPESIALMQTPPASINSHYAMGWIENTTGGQRIIEHNGVLSVYTADVALLPEEGIGIALLYNVSSLPSNAIGQPEIRAGLIALLAGEAPETGWMNVGLWGLFTALLTLTGGFLAVRSLLALPRWAQKTRVKPFWQLLPGILWTFVPALMLLWGIPALTARFADRVFGFVSLYKSMLDIFAWLAVTGVLGAINGAARIGILLRRSEKSGLEHRPVLDGSKQHTIR
jgi:CubicO group peptidase (beta-lactamase class C family)